MKKINVRRFLIGMVFAAFVLAVIFVNQNKIIQKILIFTILLGFTKKMS